MGLKVGNYDEMWEFFMQLTAVRKVSATFSWRGHGFQHLAVVSWGWCEECITGPDREAPRG